MLGAQSNGTMWPSAGVLEPSDHDDDEEEAADELETPQNQVAAYRRVSALRPHINC